MNYKAHLARCTTFLFDCDGVLWNGSKLIPGAKDTLLFLRNNGRRFFLITNNSTKSLEQYSLKCQKLGLPVSNENIICSANVAAHYLKSAGITAPVYVIGEEGIGLELKKMGIPCFGIGPDQPASDKGILEDIQIDPNVSCVLVGFDSHFNYRKLLRATTYIGRGHTFYATNEDAQLPATDRINPGTGSLVASVKYASGQDPIVMGKPHQPIFDILKNSYSIDPSSTIMIGDRLDTDILFGNRFGMLSALVMTGVTSQAILDSVNAPNSPQKELRPSLVFPSVLDILTALQSNGCS